LKPHTLACTGILSPARDSHIDKEHKELRDATPREGPTVLPNHSADSSVHQARDGGASIPRMATSQCIDWYHEGKARSVLVGDVHGIVWLIGRNGRRGRIPVLAPGGLHSVDV